MEEFKCAFSFLTILPIKPNKASEKEFRDMLCAFPTVGMVLAMIYYIASDTMLKLFDSIFFASVCYVVLTIIMTGGLHYDGLADSIDGLFSGREKDKILEIMSDSRIGTFGVLGIFINILLKMGVITLYFQYEIIYFAMFSVIFSRTMQVIYARVSKYAKADGMGNFFIGKVSDKAFYMAIVTNFINSIILCFIVKGYSFGFIFKAYAISFVISFLVMMVVRKAISRKLGGITGDILGLVAEIGETIFLFVMFFVYMIL